MKMILRISTFVFLFMAPVMAQAESLSIATGEYAPFADSSAPDHGIVNSTVAEVARRAGYEVEFDYQPWLRALEMTRAGRFIATSYWYYQADRVKDFIHVGPILRERLVFFHRADTQVPDWSRLEELSDFTIGAVAGYTYTDEFWQLANAGRLTVETAQTDEANMRKLLAGRIDLYPMSEESGLLLLESLADAGDFSVIRAHPRPLVISEGYLLVSRKAPNSETVAAALQAMLDSLEVVGN